MQPRLPLALALSPLLLAAACAPPLDPRPDIAAAAAEVQRREGSEPGGFRPDWTYPPPPAEQAGFEGTGELSADRCVALALRNNPAVRAGLAQVAQSRADLVQSGLLPNPVLAIGTGWPLPGGDAQFTFGVGVMQQLMALLQRDDRMAAADAELRARVLSLSDLALTTAADARAAHARVLFAQRGLDLARGAVDVSERAVAAEQQRVAAGESTSLSINRHQILLRRLQSQVRSRELDLALRKRELLAVIGAPGAPAEWSARSDDAATDPPLDLDEPAAVTLALDQRLDVAAAGAERRAALARVGIEETGRYGDFSIGAFYTLTDAGNNELGPSLEIPIPIFDTGDARIAGARAALIGADEAFAQVRNRATVEVRLAYVRARSLHAEAYEYQVRVVEIAEQNMTLAQKSFKAGEADTTTILNVEENLVETRARLLELQEESALAAIELRRAAGGSLRPLAPEAGPASAVDPDRRSR